MSTSSAQEFYDQLADDYHLLFRDWDASMRYQGAALDTLIQRHAAAAGAGAGAPLDILDCSSGIGTQAIALAQHGHRVTAADLSPAAAARAKNEARVRGRQLKACAADMRALPFKAAGFDAVISADNALAHLLTEADVSKALTSMRTVLREGGTLLLTVRDYAEAVRTRMQSTPPQIARLDNGESITFQLWHWHEGVAAEAAADAGADVYDLDHVQLLPDGDTWQVRLRRATLRAWPLPRLAEIAEACGFAEVEWHTPETAGYFQPVLTARKAAPGR